MTNEQRQKYLTAKFIELAQARKRKGVLLIPILIERIKEVLPAGQLDIFKD